MKRKGILIPWLGIVFILLGMLQSFSTVFDYPIMIEWCITFVCIIVAAALFITNFFRGKNTIRSILLTMGLLCFWCVWNWQRLQTEGETLLYYINQKKLAYDGSQFTAFPEKPGATGFLALLCVCCILYSLFMGLFAVRLLKCFYGLLPLYLLIFLELSVGKTPDIRSMILLVSGGILCYGWEHCQNVESGKGFWIQKISKRESYVRYVALGSVAIISMMLALVCSAGTQNFFLKNSKKYLQWQHQMERMTKEKVEQTAWKIRSWFYMDDDGNLSNTEPKYQEQAVLEVTFSMKPTTDIYLKGFTGEEYQNGKWSSPKEDEWKKIFSTKELQEDYWNTNYEYALIGFSGTVDEDHPWSSQKQVSQMQIDYVGLGKNSSYAYLPYFCNVSDVIDQDGKQALSWDGVEKIKRNGNTIYAKSVLPGTEVLQELIAYANQGMMATEDYNKPQQLEYYAVEDDMLPDVVAKNYIQYAKQEYCRLPEKGLERFRKLSESDPVLLEYGKSGRYDQETTSVSVASVVQRYLADQAVYSLELNAVPAGQDYVEYFLFRQKEGFCEHFATAGTLLLREMGVPARYASGYKIEASAFKENEDGTYTAEVLDSDAHAWTEVLSEWGGWIPAEMTPSSSHARDKKKEVQTEKPASSETDQVRVTEPVTTEQGETEKTTENTSMPAGTDKSHCAKRQRSTGVSGTKMIGIVIVLVVFGTLGEEICRKRVKFYIYRKKERETVSWQEKIIVHTEAVLYFLKMAGVKRIASCREQEWIQLVVQKSLERKEADSQIDGKKLSQVIEKATFSAKDLAQEEYLFYQKECETLLDGFYQSRSFLKKLYLKIICPLKMFL